MAGEAETNATFQNSMQTALQDQAVLGSALLPMTVSLEVRIKPQPNAGHDQLLSLCATAQVWPQGVPVTGDSLIRLLLNIPGIQTALACALLHKLPDAMEAQGGQEADSLPGLILGSLRWCLAEPSICLHALLVRCHIRACHLSLVDIVTTHQASLLHRMRRLA